MPGRADQHHHLYIHQPSGQSAWEAGEPLLFGDEYLWLDYLDAPEPKPGNVVHVLFSDRRWWGTSWGFSPPLWSSSFP